MSKTVKKVAKVLLDIPNHESFASGALAAGTYDFNLTEFIPKGALIVGIKTVETTAFSGGTSVKINVNAGTPQDLTAAIVSANWSGIRTPALDADTDGEVVTTGANLGFTSVGDYTAGKYDIYVEYIY